MPQEKFHYKSLEEVKQRAAELGVDLPFAADTHALAQPLTVRNITFPNRLGIDTQVFLGSAEVTAIASLLGRLPTKEEYMERMQVVMQKSSDIYRYMNFHRMPEYSA